MSLSFRGRQARTVSRVTLRRALEELRVFHAQDAAPCTFVVAVSYPAMPTANSPRMSLTFDFTLV